MMALMEVIMAKEQVQFVEVEIDSLSPDQRVLWNELVIAKKAFGASLQPMAPAGRRVLFSDKYNKLKIATVAMASASAKPKLSLADWQAMNASIGVRQ